MNLLFIHHDPEIQAEIDDFMVTPNDNCFFCRNTEETIRILDTQQIDLVVLIITHMRDAAVLKYINDNYKELEVLLMATEEYDEIIALFSECQYQVIRLPAKLKEMQKNIVGMVNGNQEENKRNGTNN